jgi:hypothetical protein
MFEKNTQYNGFLVTHSEKIEELNVQFVELEHQKSKAQIIKIINNDPENVFCLGFQTVPTKSNGVAHILEHTVLCGSKKYPVKDPFFSMTRRSLNTFMNALTGSDFTLYPAASCVKKDFFNLLDVYLDAVFYPNLKKLSFLQEGWRYEFEVPEDTKSPLSFAGIVFNEMKGAYASVEERLFHALFEHAFSDTTYGVDSGGDPKVIPTLSHQELLDFHKTFYAPSRCIFYLYGDNPLEEELDFLEKKVLYAATPLKPLPPIPKQKPFEAKHVTIDVPLSQENEDKAMYAINYLTCSINNQTDLLALQLLQTLLMDTDASPLKFALLKSGLCKTASLYLEADMAQVPMILMLKGCQESKGQEIHTFLNRTLNEIYQKGFEQKEIEAALHQLEFERLEISPDYGPYGLTLGLRTLLLKQHGVDPTFGLKVHSLFNQLRKRLEEDPQFLSQLIKTYLLNNSSYVFLEAHMKQGVLEQEKKDEEARLEQIKQGFSEATKQEIVTQSKTLKAFQYEQEHQDLEVLPKVTLADIPKNIKEYPLLHEKIDAFDLYSHVNFTNYVLYVDLVFDLPFIEEEDLPYLQLFSTLLTQVGNSKRSYVQQLQKVQEDVGELDCHFSLYPNAFEQRLLSPTLQISTKCLHAKAPNAFSLLQDLILHTHFEEKDRIKELITQTFVALQNNINRNALGLASQLALAGFYDSTFINEKWYGLEFYWFLKALHENFDATFEHLHKKMLFFMKFLLQAATPHVVISCSEEMLKKVHENKLFGLHLPIQKKQLSHIKSYSGNYDRTTPLSQGRLIASDVFFTAIGFESLCYADELTPSLCVLGMLLGNIHLHKEIRERGGAYGSGCKINPNFGTGYFFGYRDPNLATTVKAFYAAIDKVKKKNYTTQELIDAKLGLIQKIDLPIYPGQKAIHTYALMRQHKGIDIRAKFREQVVLADTGSIEKAVVFLENQIKNGILCAFGSQAIFNKENPKLKKELPLFNI